MVEVAAVTVLDPGREPLEDLAVQADGVSAGAERQPVEVDGAGSRYSPASGSSPRVASPQEHPMKTRTLGVALVENAIEIARSPEDVFDYWVDLEREPEWNRKARRVAKLSDGPIGLGTRFEAEFLKGNAMTIEFVRFERPLAWETVGHSAAWTSRVKGGSRRQSAVLASSCGWSCARRGRSGSAADPWTLHAQAARAQSRCDQADVGRP